GAVDRLAPAREQPVELLLASDDARVRATRRERRAVCALALAGQRPGLDRAREALERERTLLAEGEDVADEHASLGGEQCGAGFGRGLQPRGEVRRLAGDDEFARRPLADDIADN